MIGNIYKPIELFFNSNLNDKHKSIPQLKFYQPNTTIGIDPNEYYSLFHTILYDNFQFSFPYKTIKIHQKNVKNNNKNCYTKQLLNIRKTMTNLSIFAKKRFTKGETNL